MTPSAQHYYVDPYARCLDATVTRCEEYEGAIWVELDRTLLYPTGGGQPHDLGRLGELQVMEVQKREGRVEHRVTAPLEPGTKLRVELDWSRRFDHMQQHSGQHLLSAVAQDEFGWPTMAFHLGERTCTVDLDTPRITDEQRLALEGRINALIGQALPLHARQVDRETFDQLHVRTRGLPDDVTGPIRLIEIEGVDLNTCGGTHLRNTAELNAIKLLHTEKIRGQTRLHFVAGQRVFDRYEAQLRRERALNDLLKAGPEEHAALIANSQASAKQSRRVTGALLDELASKVAKGLAAGDALLLVHHHELGDTSRAFMQKLQRALRALDTERPLLLTGRDEGGPPGGTFSLSGSPELVDALKALVLHGLEAKGGGRPGQLQGKAARLDEATRSALVERLKQAIAKAD